MWNRSQPSVWVVKMCPRAKMSNCASPARHFPFSAMLLPSIVASWRQLQQGRHQWRLCCCVHRTKGKKQTHFNVSVECARLVRASFLWLQLLITTFLVIVCSTPSCSVIQVKKPLRDKSRQLLCVSADRQFVLPSRPRWVMKSYRSIVSRVVVAMLQNNLRSLKINWTS